MKKHIKKKRMLMILSLGWLFLCVLYSEILFAVLLKNQFSPYIAGFSLCIGAFLALISFISKKEKVRFVIMGVCTPLISLMYIVQLLYFRIFNTLLIFHSLALVGDAAFFAEIAFEKIWTNLLPVILFLLPSAIYFIFIRKGLRNVPADKKVPLLCLLVCVLVGAITTTAVLLDSKGALSARRLFLSEFVHEASLQKFGLLTAAGLDFRYNVLEIRFEDETPIDLDNVEIVDSFTQTSQTSETTAESSETEASAEPTEPEIIVYEPNVMDIEFPMDETDKDLKEMNVYFSNREPTMKNEYTGMFEGKNFILITAEAFSGDIIDPELTPTLYKLSTEGFVFNNFYTPIWNVSTASGEYVAMNGILPDLGTIEYVVIQDRYMPFSFAHQFANLGYSARAYHNHTYTYYDRHITYPNLGYDYKGYGNGLDVKYTWPESDLEMINLTASEYMPDPPFHVYYLTVSGHCNYNFYGNYISVKNKDLVAHLDYSEPVRAYLAAQLELEFALTELLAKLEVAGQLENTVIALSADHYPFGLVDDNDSFQYINELAGEEVDLTFELFRNAFILWAGDMEEPVIVDKYCSSLDIAPTIANLFGLEYDSRLYIGRDILSDAPAFVVFKDYSFINDKIKYNMKTKQVTRLVDEDITDLYLEVCVAEVKNMFKYSRLIYRKDYYGYLFDQS